MITSNPGNGKYFEVKCKEPLVGSEIQLTTTKNTWLQINSVEPFGWNASSSKTTTSTSSGSSSTTYNVAANTKVEFNVSSAKQSTNYSNSNFLPDFAFKGPTRFTHTKKGVGQWWEVGFNQPYLVDRVRVKNRHNCCGNRLNRTKVFVGTEECGSVNGGSNGAWYTVKCSKPIFGNKIRLVTV
jgi:hypothetical protein